MYTKFGKQKIQTLVNTGADVSVMSVKFFEKLDTIPIKTVSLDKNGLAHCTSASCNVLTNVGKAMVEFELGQKKFQCTFQILKGLAKQVILGSDFLGKHKALIDIREATLRIGKMYSQWEKGIVVHWGALW